jgi:hypothetical protein
MSPVRATHDTKLCMATIESVHLAPGPTSAPMGLIDEDFAEGKAGLGLDPAGCREHAGGGLDEAMVAVTGLPEVPRRNEATFTG